MSLILNYLDKKLQKYSGMEEKLKQIARITVPGEANLKMKASIMARINSRKKIKENIGFELYIKKIKLLASALQPNDYFRILLKEKLMIFIEFDKKRSSMKLRKFINILKWRTSRKAFAAAMVFVFVLTLVFNFSFNIQEVKALYDTKLDSVSGEVFVIRGDETIIGSEGLLLRTNDLVLTAKGSNASIRFLDQSIGRLDEEGELRISELSVNPQNKSETVVGIVLNKGRLWARVFNLISDESRFQVKADNTVAVAKKKAAFNVTVAPQGKLKVAKVSAIKNKVEVVVADGEKVVETTLMNGFSAEVKSTDTSAETKIKLEEPKPEEETWVAENLTKDDVYIATLKEEAKVNAIETTKIIPGHPLYGMKQLTENTQIAFTFDSFDKQKKILITAKEKLAQVTLLIEEENNEEAAKVLQQFQAQAQDAVNWIRDHEEESPEDAFSLNMQLTEILDQYKKQLAVVLPDDPLYGVKEVVSETKVLVAPDPLQKAQEQLEQASDKLLEADEMISAGNTLGATAQVAKYTETVSQVVFDVKRLGADDKAKAVTTLIDSKVKDLKTLESIAANVTNNPTVSGTAVNAEGAAVPLEPVTGEEAVSTDGEKSVEINQGGFGDGIIVDTAQQAALNNAVNIATDKDLQKVVAEVKTDALKKVGEAVLDVHQNQPSVEVLQKLDTLNNVDVNGKKIVDVNLTQNKVTIRSDGNYFSVVNKQVEPLAPATTEKIPAVIAPVVLPLIAPLIPGVRSAAPTVTTPVVPATVKPRTGVTVSPVSPQKQP